MWYIIVIRDGKPRGRLAGKYPTEEMAQVVANRFNKNSDVYAYRPFFYERKLTTYEEGE